MGKGNPVFDWSRWFSLKGAGQNKAIPGEAGIYRIRRSENTSLDYVGQTGPTLGLRRRLGMLKGVYGRVMPYNDPHTAGPALWALRQLENFEYEASGVPVSASSTPLRKGFECLVIAQHRQEFGKSPTFNFGRMPRGYSKSTSNTRQLVARGKRRRGDLTDEILASHQPGLAPLGPIEGAVIGEDLLGFKWSPWIPVANGLNTLNENDVGLYRLKRNGVGKLTYVGEGKIKDRVEAHLKKGEQPNHSQAFAFSEPQFIELSYIQRHDLAKHQRLEIENDIIAAHVLQLGEVPSAQFLG